MTVVKVNTKYVPRLDELLRMILVWIYEPHNLNGITEEYILRSYNTWAQKVDLMYHENFILVQMGKMIKRHGRGGFEKRKKMFREHNIDWRRFHKLPEAQLNRREWVRALIKNQENDARIVREIS